MNYLYCIAILVVIYALLSEGLNLIMGHGGIFSMGHGAFFAVGAYVSALLYTRVGMAFPLELLMSALAAMLCGLMLSLAAMRLKGDYITFCSYGFAIVVYTVANNWLDVTNGPTGISGIMRPTVFGLSFTTLPQYLLLCLMVTAISFLVMYRVVHSPYGKSIEAFREDEAAAYASGINVALRKTQVFCIGAFFAGLAGCLYAHYMMICDPTSFKISVSSLLVCMVIIGGMGSMLGAVAGAIIVIGLPELLTFLGLSSSYSEQIQDMIYSLLLIVIIVNRPRGLFGKLKF